MLVIVYYVTFLSLSIP